MRIVHANTFRGCGNRDIEQEYITTKIIKYGEINKIVKCDSQKQPLPPQ